MKNNFSELILSSYENAVKLFQEKMNLKEKEGFIISRDVMEDIFNETRENLVKLNS